MYMWAFVRLCAFVCGCGFFCLYVYVRSCVGVYMCIYVCINVRVRKFMCVYV